MRETAARAVAGSPPRELTRSVFADTRLGNGGAIASANSEQHRQAGGRRHEPGIQLLLAGRISAGAVSEPVADVGHARLAGIA